MSAMKEVATLLEENGIHLEEVDIVATRSLKDEALLIDIQTSEGGGHVRINLNDGTIWDQDPELDVPAMLDGFAVALGTYKTKGSPDFTYPILTCTDCMEAIVHGPANLRTYVAAAREHADSCTPLPKTTTLEGVTL